VGGGVDWASDIFCLSWTDRNVTTEVAPHSVHEARLKNYRMKKVFGAADVFIYTVPSVFHDPT